MYYNEIEKIKKFQAEIWSIAHHQRDLNPDMTAEYWLLESILDATNAIESVCEALEQLQRKGCI